MGFWAGSDENQADGQSGLFHRRISFLVGDRVVGFDKSRCGQLLLNGSNGRVLDLPLISGILTDAPGRMSGRHLRELAGS
jgi:hypothetical protein